MPIQRLVRVLLWGALLGWAPGMAGFAVAAQGAEGWKNDEFVKRAQIITRGNWEKATTRDVAIVQLFEVGRKAERLEQQLKSQLDRFYTLAYRGALALGVFLLLHLILTLAMLARLGRLSRPRRSGAAGAEDFRL